MIDLVDLDSEKLKGLIRGVFNPQKGERVQFAFDVPHGVITTNQEWEERILMTKNLSKELKIIAIEEGFLVDDILSFNATGSHGGVLPKFGQKGGQEVEIAKVLESIDICLFLTQFSATSFLKTGAKDYGFRGASMPTIHPRMQKALLADYELIGKRCGILQPKLTSACGVEIVFSSGHELFVDISGHEGHKDNGKYHNKGDLGNLPAGETYVVPYGGKGSKTAGYWPVMIGSELFVFIVEKNKISKIEGDGPEAAKQRIYFLKDQDSSARCHLAEVGFGLNPDAVDSGNVLEGEKAEGLHLAYGLDQHLDPKGSIGPSAFKGPAVHQDIVYSVTSPISISKLELIYPNGKELIISDGKYEEVLWNE